MVHYFSPKFAKVLRARRWQNAVKIKLNKKLNNRYKRSKSRRLMSILGKLVHTTIKNSRVDLGKHAILRMSKDGFCIGNFCFADLLKYFESLNRHMNVSGLVAWSCLVGVCLGFGKGFC